MEINDELLEKWEPKVQKFLQTAFVTGMDREDIAQELRIAIIKAADHYDDSKGVIFHTYLHTVMVNTLRTLISKAQKTKNVNITYSIDGMDVNDNPQGFLPNEIANSLADESAMEFVNNVELMDIISENLDNINIALDTDFWNGGQLLLGAIDSDYKAAIFSGTENQGTIETRELELFPGHRSSITNIRPIVDATSTVTVKSRERLADDATESSSSSMVTSGDNPVRQSGRYFKIKVVTPSGSTWTHAQGVDINATRIGLR